MNDRASTSLIISSRERPAFLEELVDAILAAAEQPTELIVVDQSATANRRLQARAVSSGGRLRYEWSRDRGLSRGRNLGIQVAGGDWLLFLDDDVVIPSDWVGRMRAAAIAAGPRTVLTGRVVSGTAETAGAFAPSLHLSELPVVHRGRPGRDVLQPLNMAIHRAAVSEVGLFDTRLGAGSRFPSSEDNDLGFRLLEAGYSILYDPSLVVVHRAWRPPSELLPLRWRYGRGQGAYFAKHLSLRDRYMLRRLWADWWRHVRRSPRRARAHPRDGAADLVYSTGLLAGALEWVVTRPPD